MPWCPTAAVTDAMTDTRGERAKRDGENERYTGRGRRSRTTANRTGGGGTGDGEGKSEGRGGRVDRGGRGGMCGKAEGGPVGIAAIRKHGAAYLMAVGGAAYLVSKAIRASRTVAFADLGMEAIYEFDVKDMPVTVAVDARGQSVHHTAPREWQARIGKIPVAAL